MVLTQRQPAETARRPAAPASGPWLVQRGGRFVQVTELLALPQRQPAETARRPAAPASGPPPVPSGGVDDVDDVDTLPERPALAPQVVLSGELKDAGFAHQQWLVQRGGRFVQVTELLYRILERADGQRTLDEIAAGVSQAIGRGVSADQVGHLIARKLIPAGLVAGAPGPLGPAPDAVGRGWMRSPLAVNLRLRVVGPDHIERVTRVLQVLYLPPVLVAVLAAVAAAHGWLYFGHGIGGSARAAVDTPGLMVVVLGAIVLSAAFHEFGHAAALRYGGGQVRGMGVGLYLVYPVFYTDVTDSYRLGRWARVRTDLGGLYFNLIFTLGVMALYAATGQEFLLLIVAVIDLEIVHQLLPLVRLDGYWLLADLTGLPDFFSQMGPFVRSLLPIPGWHERTLCRTRSPRPRIRSGDWPEPSPGRRPPAISWERRQSCRRWSPWRCRPLGSPSCLPTWAARPPGHCGAGAAQPRPGARLARWSPPAPRCSWPSSGPPTPKPRWKPQARPGCYLDGMRLSPWLWFSCPSPSPGGRPVGSLLPDGSSLPMFPPTRPPRPACPRVRSTRVEAAQAPCPTSLS
jgi:putative peptide zinc metalloprotease protein